MKNLTIPLQFDLGLFLKFFGQLSQENKELIFNALMKMMLPKPASVPPDEFPLHRTVLHYDLPFEPVAGN